jgi:hypothetical protein
MLMAADANYVVESYADYLTSVRKKLWERFQKTRINAPESALAEAVVFRVLQTCNVNPVVADVPGAGGPDFLCAGGTADQFLVEATSFTPEKVTKDTNIRNQVPEDLEGGPFGLLTSQVDEKATEKLRQFADIEMPGVLAIASTHFGASIVFNSMAAENALISQPFWVAGREGMSTDLACSLFLRGEDGEVVRKNCSLSAVLLVAVGSDRSYVCGALSPCATFRFNSALLWQIPFIYLMDWPVEKNKLRCEWTMGNQRAFEIPHAGIRR